MVASPSARDVLVSDVLITDVAFSTIWCVCFVSLDVVIRSEERRVTHSTKNTNNEIKCDLFNGTAPISMNRCNKNCAGTIYNTFIQTVCINTVVGHF